MLHKGRRCGSGIQMKSSTPTHLASPVVQGKVVREQLDLADVRTLRLGRGCGRERGLGGLAHPERRSSHGLPLIAPN